MAASFLVTFLSLLMLFSSGCGGRVDASSDPLPGDSVVADSPVADDAIADDVVVDDAIADSSASDTGVDTTTEVDPTLKGLQIVPGADNVTIGTSKVFRAIATRSDGTTEDVSASAIWVPSAPGYMKVVGGVLTGLADCKCWITAYYGGKSATAKVRVWSWTLVGVSIQPSNPSIYLGDTLRVEATATYSDGAGGIIAGPAAYASWTVASEGKIAKITPEKFGTEAAVFGFAPGVDKVRVTYDGMTGEASVTVIDHSVTGLDVSPYAATIFTKGVASLVATIRYKDGTSSDVTSTAMWTSSDPTIATVSAGTAYGLKPGTVTISATASSLSGKSRSP